MKHRRFLAGVALLSVTVVLAACGSSGGGEASDTPPAGASTPVEAPDETAPSEPAGSGTEDEPSSVDQSAPESAPSESGPTVEKAGGKMTFNLNWFPTGDHAAYYVAQEKGWYKDDGLTVDIQPGSGSGATAQRVGAGQADCGIADAGVVINAIRNGADLTMVGMIFDNTGNTAWALKKSGITKPADLAGHSVGVPAGDSQRVLFPALAEANDFDASEVDFVDVKPEAKYTTLASGRVDAIFDAATGAPFIYKAVGKDNVVEMRWADYGVNLYGLAIFCNDSYLQDNAGTVVTFLDNSYRGWAWTMENNREALEIEKKYSPTIDIDEYMENLAIGISLMCTPRYEENGIGWMDEGKMADTLKIMQDLTDADSNIDDVSTVYTNEYLTRHDLPEGTCS